MTSRTCGRLRTPSRRAGGEFEAGLVYSPGWTGENDPLMEQARELPNLGAVRVLLHDPTGSLQPHRARELVTGLREATGLPVGIYCQGSGGNALAAALEAARAGADLIASAVYPIALTLHRVSGEALAEALAGLGLDCDIDVSALWEASDVVDEHIGDEPVTPLAPRIAVRAAQHDLPASLVAALDSNLRAQAAGARLDETIAELVRIRAEVGWPPLASPIGQVLGSQALLNVLSATRYTVVVDELRSLVEGHLGTTPAPIEKSILRMVSLTADPDSEEDTTAPPLQEVRAQAEGLASSEEELLLLGLFGDNAEPLLRTIRGRSSGDESLAAGGVDQARAERIRELVRIVQDTGIGEVTIEEAGMRVSVRRTQEREPAAGQNESPLAAVGGSRARSSRSERHRARRGADGRDVLPRVAAGRAAVRRGRTTGWRGPDTLHSRGDEAHERGESRRRRNRPCDPCRERLAG